MTPKTTPSGRALEDAIDRLPYGKNTDETLAGHWVNDNYDAIIRALKISYAVDTWPTSSGSAWNEAVTDTIERLKGIGHDENR